MVLKDCSRCMVYTVLDSAGNPILQHIPEGIVPGRNPAVSSFPLLPDGLSLGSRCD